MTAPHTKIFSLLVAALLTGTASIAVAEDTGPSAVATTKNQPDTPRAGKTSFTKSQARLQMEKRGYTVATDPVKTASGIWHAEARKTGGGTVRLMMDFQGNVFEAALPREPIAGKTRLTSDQARDQMRKRGYNVTSIPIKDDQGIWYAESVLNGASSVQVMVDYQGNVFESGEYTGHPSSAPGLEPTLPNPVKPGPLPPANN